MSERLSPRVASAPCRRTCGRCNPGWRGELARRARQAIQATALPDPPSEADLRLLLCLSRMEGCSQTELADILDVTDATVGRQVDSLEARRLISRRRHPQDRRATCVHLGERAAEYIQVLSAKHLELSARAMRRLGPADQAQLLRMLRVVQATLMHDQAPETLPRASAARIPTR